MLIQYIGISDNKISYSVSIGEETFSYFTGLGWFVPKYNKNGKFNKKPENSKAIEGGWIKLPTENDILECLYLDAEVGNQSFLDFCDSLGYSNDSIKALDIYRACMETAKKISKLERQGLIKRPVNP